MDYFRMRYSTIRIGVEWHVQSFLIPMKGKNYGLLEDETFNHEKWYRMACTKLLETCERWKLWTT